MRRTLRHFGVAPGRCPAKPRPSPEIFRPVGMIRALNRKINGSLRGLSSGIVRRQSPDEYEVITEFTGQMPKMDTIDRKIATCLMEDARLSLAEISTRVGLSTSAVNDRIQKLRLQGAIRGIRADLDPAAFGRPVLAFLFVALARGISEEAFRADIAGRREVTACHHVTGGWNYLI